MVAATILGLAITGAFAFIGLGRALDEEEVLRRQAYQYVTAALEDTVYSYPKYAKIVAGVRAPEDVFLRTSDGIDLIGSRQIEVTIPDPKISVMAPPDEGTLSLPCKKVSAKVKWSLAGKADSVYLEKVIADAG